MRRRRHTRCGCHCCQSCSWLWARQTWPLATLWDISLLLLVLLLLLLLLLLSLLLLLLLIMLEVLLHVIRIQ